MNSKRQKRKLLLVIRHSPYGSSLARAGLDAALACTAFEQDIQLLFCGEGVLQLHALQNPEMIGRKSVARQLSSLPLYDIEKVYVDHAAAAAYGLDLSAAPIATETLDGAGMHQLMSHCDHLLSF